MACSDSTYIRFAVWKIRAIWDLVGWAKSTRGVEFLWFFQEAGQQCGLEGVHCNKGLNTHGAGDGRRVSFYSEKTSEGR